MNPVIKQLTIMSFHHNLQQWQALCLKENCGVCQTAPMDPGTVDVYEFKQSWLIASVSVCLKGTCCLVAKPHVVELYDFTEAELLAFMKEAQVTAHVLKQVTSAIKINYEIHGNTVPHLHMHFFPRYVDDPFPGGPIDYRQIDPPVYQRDEFEQFVQAMQQGLASTAQEQPQ